MAKFLDKTGLDTFWAKIKTALDSKVSSVKKNGSTISPTSGVADIGYMPVTRGETTGTVQEIIQAVRVKPGGSMGSVLVRNSTISGITIPGAWYNYIWIPHQTGTNTSDNQYYGTLIISPLASAPDVYVIEGSALNDASPQYRAKQLTGDFRTIAQDVSKGANLVVNGSGRMGNNYNFSGFTYLPTICNNGSAGSFGFNGEHSLNEYISVDFTKRIFFTADIKNLVVQPSNCYHRICVKEYDIDKREIVGQMVLYGANTLTTLAEDLNPGDTTVHITDASHANWQTTTTHCKGLIFWNYSNSYGYTYPPESYSRNVYPSTDSVSLWDDGAVNASTGVITLKAAWSGPAIPAGTKVSRRSSGNNFPYPAGALNVTNTDWHTMSGYMQGVYDIGENKRDSTKFSYGTEFIKVGMYPTGLSNTDETTGKRAVVTNFYVYECSDLSNTSGVLPISKGGTGQTTATAGQYALLNPKNVELTANMSDGSRIMFASTSASTSAGVFAGYRQASAFWTYIKDKISSVLGLSESGYTGNSATASAAAGYTSGGAIDTALQGKATPADITTAINDLDVASQGGDGKYIKAISESNGKISATAETMDTAPTKDSTKAVTSGGVQNGTVAIADAFVRRGSTDYLSNWMKVAETTFTSASNTFCSSWLVTITSRNNGSRTESFFLNFALQAGTSGTATPSACNFYTSPVKSNANNTRAFKAVVNGTSGNYTIKIYYTAGGMDRSGMTMKELNAKAAYSNDGTKGSWTYHSYGTTDAGESTEPTGDYGYACEWNCVQPDWEQTTTTADDYIKNKPLYTKSSGSSSIIYEVCTLPYSAQSSRGYGIEFIARYGNGVVEGKLLGRAGVELYMKGQGARNGNNKLTWYSYSTPANEPTTTTVYVQSATYVDLRIVKLNNHSGLDMSRFGTTVSELPSGVTEITPRWEASCTASSNGNPVAVNEFGEMSIVDPSAMTVGSATNASNAASGSTLESDIKSTNIVCTTSSASARTKVLTLLSGGVAVRYGTILIVKFDNGNTYHGTNQMQFELGTPGSTYTTTYTVFGVPSFDLPAGAIVAFTYSYYNEFHAVGSICRDVGITANSYGAYYIVNSILSGTASRLEAYPYRSPSGHLDTFNSSAQYFVNGTQSVLYKMLNLTGTNNVLQWNSKNIDEYQDIAMCVRVVGYYKSEYANGEEVTFEPYKKVNGGSYTVADLPEISHFLQLVNDGIFHPFAFTVNFRMQYSEFVNRVGGTDNDGVSLYYGFKYANSTSSTQNHNITVTQVWTRATYYGNKSLV